MSDVFAKRRIAALTGVRGVAALWVFVYHLWENLQGVGIVHGDRPPGVASGWMAVDMFFILSGFVLYLNHAGAIAAAPLRATADFAVNRVARILPPHFVVLAAFAVALAVAPGWYWGPGPFTLPALAASLLLVQSWIGWSLAWNSASWTLSAEWAAYVVFPLAMLVAVRVRDRRTLLLLGLVPMALLAGIVAVSHPHTLAKFMRLGVPKAIGEFLLGCLLARAAALRPLSPAMGDYGLWLALPLLAVAAVAGGYAELLVPIACLLMIAGCATDRGACDAVFGNRVVRFFGDISFSFYLWHFLVIRTLCLAAVSAGLSWSGQLLVAGVVPVVATVLVAWPSSRWIERIGPTLHRRHRNRARAAAAPAAAATTVAAGRPTAVS